LLFSELQDSIWAEAKGGNQRTATTIAARCSELLCKLVGLALRETDVAEDAPTPAGQHLVALRAQFHAATSKPGV